MAGRAQKCLRLLGAGLLTLSTGTAAATAGAVGTATAALAADQSSAVTVTGSPAFPGLAVTVSKTTELVNEVVQVSWTGARPTQGNFALNYLQIMQCWGDDAAGPERTQCQSGGLSGDLRGGAFVSSRQVTYDITDPRETLTASRPNQLRYVPFRSVTGKTTEAGLSEFFDGSTTNEIPYAGTRADGGGTLPFEVQTSTEAPGLGCGTKREAQPSSPSPRPAGGATSATPTATTAAMGAATGTAATEADVSAPERVAADNPGQRCWLVVVPRGDTEVDGSQRTADQSRQLISSPLSQSNWDQRLVLPLDFVALGQPCPLGKAERAVVGQEAAVEAVSSWQPTLCAGDGPVYSYSQLSDILARQQAVGDSPVLAVTSQPLEPDQVRPGSTPIYAPVLLSGITVAFNIDSQSAFSASPEVKARNGQRITELNLTPRLVAKLLTQSYQVAAARDRKGLEKNPLDLTRDPDFLKDNPAFRELSYTGVGSIVVPAGLSDTAGRVWQWMLADVDAKAFLDGAADPFGMVVNPAYKGVGQQSGFPKSDEECTTFLTDQPPLCTLDAFPYAGDSHEAARAAARGDTLSRSTYDPASVPPSYKRSTPQPTGSRSVLALADTATALRYDLQSARLRNAAGNFVRPDEAGLLAGLAAMKPGPVASVLEPTVASTQPLVYPLTNLSYAVTTPAGLTPQARKEYATFLQYAAGPGQRPGITFGTLPPGDVPLPQALRTQTLAVAKTIGTIPPTAGASAKPSSAGSPAGTGAGGTGGLGTGGDSGGESSLSAGSFDSGGVFDSAGLDPVAGPLPLDEVLPQTAADLGAAASTAPAPQTIDGPVLAQRIPADDVSGAARYSVVIVLAAGGVAALAGSFLRRTQRAPVPRLA